MGSRGREAAYLAGAIPVRLVTEGVDVALVLLAARELHDVALGGLLIVFVTAPSVVAAPLIGGVLDGARRPRLVMLAGAVVFAAAMLVTAEARAAPFALVAVALLAAGCALPLFLGGLSAFVGQVMPGDPARAAAVDALSYNLAGVAGPAVVGAISALAGPTGALLLLAAGILAGAGVLQTLPVSGRSAALRPRALAAGVVAALRHLVTHGPLARVITGGAIVQVGGGMLPVVAVLVAVARGQREDAAAVLLAAFSAGGVAGALAIAVPAVTRRLAAFRAERVMAAAFAATGAGVVLAAVLPGFAGAAVGLVLAGLPDATGVAAMLRLRRDESPEPVRAQVFVVGAGARVAAAAVGAGLAAVLSGAPATALLVLVGVFWIAAAPILLAGRPRTD